MTRRLFAAVILVLVAAACSPPSADDLVRGVVERRNNYTAELKSWTQREDGSLYLDVLVVNNNPEGSLRTLTVLIEQLDADGNVLGASREVLDVVALTAGLGQSVGVTLAGVAPQVEGIILRRETQPAEEDWAEFPEFDAVRPRI
jgi:hypothetical protein